MKYILDSNVVSGLIREQPSVQSNLIKHAFDEIYLCLPVYFEIVRGLLWKDAVKKIVILEQLRSQLDWIDLQESDWQLAARLWAAVNARGRQLSDIDLLIGALAIRLDAVLVTDDNDYDALPQIPRENWRLP